MAANLHIDVVVGFVSSFNSSARDACDVYPTFPIRFT